MSETFDEQMGRLEAMAADVRGVVAAADDLAVACAGTLSLCAETRAALEGRAGSWADAHREHPITSRLVVHVQRAVIDLRREVGHQLTAAGGR